jgi:hypothetical protein
MKTDYKRMICGYLILDLYKGYVNTPMTNPKANPPRHNRNNDFNISYIF